MGNVVNKGGEIKSSLFGCYCGGEKSICLTPNTYSEIRVGAINDNYMTPYTHWIPVMTVVFVLATLILSCHFDLKIFIKKADPE